jgi:hypothetical protein
MTQPIASYHDQIWSDLRDEEDPFVPRPSHPGASAASPSPGSVWRDLGDEPDPFLQRATAPAGSLLGRATSGRSVPGATPSPPGIILGVPRIPAKVKAGLDAFLTSAFPTFHTPAGDVVVQIPFHAPGGAVAPAPGSPQMTALLHASVALGMNGNALHTVLVGRGTLQEIHDLAQELIRAGHLPSDSRPADVRVRALMQLHGLGIDPTAYVRQAFLVATGVTLRQAHFGSPLGDDLSALAARGFARVTVARAKPGDILALRSATPRGPGYRAIVYDARPADAGQLHAFTSLVRGAHVPPSSGHVTAITVDSSVGPSGACDQPGPFRVTLYHDDWTNVWASPKNPTLSGRCVLTLASNKANVAPLLGMDVTLGRPLGHLFEGVYRFVGQGRP